MTDIQNERSSYLSTITRKGQQIPYQGVLDVQWVVGFVDGEGCFHVGISKNYKSRLGVQVLPEFTIVQHSRDIELLYRLQQFFDCGVVRVNNGDRMAFRVRKTCDLFEKIIPFFDKYTLQTKKNRDFFYFKQILFLMQEDCHLSIEGIDRIKKIANLMNCKGVTTLL